MPVFQALCKKYEAVDAIVTRHPGLLEEAAGFLFGQEELIVVEKCFDQLSAHGSVVCRY